MIGHLSAALCTHLPMRQVKVIANVADTVLLVASSNLVARFRAIRGSCCTSLRWLRALISPISQAVVLMMMIDNVLRTLDETITAFLLLWTGPC